MKDIKDMDNIFANGVVPTMVYCPPFGIACITHISMIVLVELCCCMAAEPVAVARNAWCEDLR